MSWLTKLIKRRSSAPPPAQHPLYFKNGVAAFEMASKYMSAPIAAGNLMIALIEDPRELEDLMNDAGAAVKTDESGRQTALLNVASDRGTFQTIAQTATGSGSKLQPGDLVAWIPMQKHKDLGWIGLIVAKLKPEYVNGAWSIDCKYQ